MMSNTWRWSDTDIGWAYVRFRNDGEDTRKTVPANFIQDFKRGDKIRGDYLYKVFWSPEQNDSPVKYLKQASNIPLFEQEQPSKDFGKAGLYRATVYVAKDTLKEIEDWKKQKRVRDVPTKLLQSSFDVISTAPATSNTRKKHQKGSSSTPMISNSKSGDGKSKSSKQKKDSVKERQIKSGTLDSVASLRSQLEAQVKDEDSGDEFLQTRHSSIRKANLSGDSADSDDSTKDPSVPSPRKVQKMQSELDLQKQELRKLGKQKARLQMEINRMAEEREEFERMQKKTEGPFPDALKNDAPLKSSNTSEADRKDDHEPDIKNIKAASNDDGLLEQTYSDLSDTHSEENELQQHSITSEVDSKEDKPDQHSGASKAHSKDEPQKLSKRKARSLERDAKRAKMTSLVPIPNNFDYQEKAFKINEDYQIDAAHMRELWDIERGKSKDGVFVKRAAVMLFGSVTLVEVGCVVGIKKNGIARPGLNPVALEGIRVLLILRARREGEDVKWDTERTKQATVNAFISEKNRTLENAKLKMEAKQKRSN